MTVDCELITDKIIISEDDNLQKAMESYHIQLLDVNSFLDHLVQSEN